MVYFVQPVGGGQIKIGTTVRLTERLRALQREYDRELRVLAVVNGSYEEERALHCRFRHLRVENEIFEPGEDLLGFIAESGRAWDGTDESPMKIAKIENAILRDARIVVAITGDGLSEYLSNLLRPLVARDKERALAQENAPPRKPKP